ncbi:hypothetical protein U1Q18_039612, partial [Sarracenia purpurea var. burkii]
TRRSSRFKFSRSCSTYSSQMSVNSNGRGRGWGRPKRSSSSKATGDWSSPCGSYFTDGDDGVAQTRVLGRASLRTLPLFARPSPILALESA